MRGKPRTGKQRRERAGTARKGNRRRRRHQDENSCQVLGRSGYRNPMNSACRIHTCLSPDRCPQAHQVMHRGLPTQRPPNLSGSSEASPLQLSLFRPSSCHWSGAHTKGARKTGHLAGESPALDWLNACRPPGQSKPGRETCGYRDLVAISMASWEVCAAVH
ncbi:hypothetical protein VUR80DRAFT_4545 [Thermomyces stellatus]